MNDKFHGTIVTYSEDATSGVVRDHIGRHYVFHVYDWFGTDADLKDGMEVEFYAHSGRAVRVAKQKKQAA